MAKDGNATCIGKSKLKAYRRGSHGSRCRHCSKDVIIALKGRDISDSWSRHILNPSARVPVDNPENRLAGAIGRCYVESIVSGVVPHLITTSDLRDHIDDVAIDGIHNVGSATRRHQHPLKWSEHDAIHATGTVGYPIFLCYPHAPGIDDSDIWRRCRHGDEKPVELGIPPWLLQACSVGQFKLPSSLRRCSCRDSSCFDYPPQSDEVG